MARFGQIGQGFAGFGSAKDYLRRLRWGEVRLQGPAIFLPPAASAGSRPAPPQKAAERFEAIQTVLLLFVAGLVLVAQLAGMSLLVRLAALPGLALLFWQARRLWVSSRQ